MTSEFNRYPIAGKAFREQQNIVRDRGGDLSPEYVEEISRTVKIIDLYADGSPEEKQGVMIAAIMMESIAFDCEDIARFSKGYTPAVSACVDAQALSRHANEILFAERLTDDELRRSARREEQRPQDDSDSRVHGA